MRATTSMVVVSILLAMPMLGAAENPPRIFQSDPQALLESRKGAVAGEASLAPALAQLKQKADKALSAGPYAVTDKKVPSITGDPHDYVSLAPYFWPNPDTKDGLPYVRRDGRRNPETRQYDAGRFGAMSGSANTLAIAFYLTGNETYAQHAARLLRAWFLDPQTRMNPNLEHAQMIKGVDRGRGTGIIESARLLGVIDAIGLLHDSKAWTADDQQGMQRWFSEYLKWMRESKNGRQEAAAANNHGTWYDVQVVTFALFLGQHDLARQVMEEAKTRRIARQIEPDGSMPRELARTNSLGYSVFNIEALTALADLAARENVDLWNYQGPDGRSLRRAIDCLLPYVTAQKKWERQQITPFNPTSMFVPLRRAARALHEPRYQQAIAALHLSNQSAMDALRFPTGQ